MIVKCTTTYTLPNNIEGRHFAENFISIHEWGGAEVQKDIKDDLIKVSINTLVETKETVYGMM